MEQTKLVFVYGSLRRGFGLSPVLSSSEFVADVRTKPKYTMYSVGAFPCITKGGNTGIVGEIYKVDLPTLRRLDMIEGVPQLYKKSMIEVDGYDDVIAYFFTDEKAEGLKIIENGDWANAIQ